MSKHHYQRKTIDVWNIQQYTGSRYGWETVTRETTYKAARERAREYRENQPEYPVRVRYGRERKEEVRVYESQN